MRIIPERLDYLWFLSYGLDDEVPDPQRLVVAGAGEILAIRAEGDLVHGGDLAF